MAKTYWIEVQQTLTGCVEIEANSVQEALRIADQRFNENGEELPDMDDCEPLTFAFARLGKQEVQ